MAAQDRRRPTVRKPTLFLREWREAKKVSQELIADAMDTDKSQVSRLEGDMRRVTVDWLEAYAEVLEVDREDLYRPPSKEDTVGFPSIDRMIKDVDDSTRQQIFKIVAALTQK